MRFVAMIAVVGVACAALAMSAVSAVEKKVSTPLAFKMKGLDGKEVDLAQYKGKVVLIVNVASQCGYTPQYSGLQKLYETYKGDGLVVLGVPANEFGKQEPGSDEEIAKFCETKYNVSFPMLSKVVVKGEDKTPLYEVLTSKETSKFPGEVGWNFEKFLIGRDGSIVGRYKSNVKPDSAELTAAIKAELEKK